MKHRSRAIERRCSWDVPCDLGAAMSVGIGTTTGGVIDRDYCDLHGAIVAHLAMQQVWEMIFEETKHEHDFQSAIVVHEKHGVVMSICRCDTAKWTLRFEKAGQHLDSTLRISNDEAQALSVKNLPVEDVKQAGWLAGVWGSAIERDARIRSQSARSAQREESK